jgi:uncharacterized protein with PCYCGC motif
MKRFLALTLLMSLLLSGVLMAGCAANSAHNLNLFPTSALPYEMQTAPTVVREAYQFAAANADLMQNIPCYCGCGAVGHKSNYACYVKNAQSDGTVVFDQHALGCSLCVDITQDVMRLSREGKSPGDIRAFVVSTYSKFGPPNQ